MLPTLILYPYLFASVNGNRQNFGGAVFQCYTDEVSMHRWTRIADSISKNAFSFSSARTIKHFRSSRCASTIQIDSLDHGLAVSVLSDSNT